MPENDNLYDLLGIDQGDLGCMMGDSCWVYDETRHREETLFLVRGSALQAGISEEQFERFLNHALNAGIVFRERC